MKKRINFAIKSWKGKRPTNQDSLACAFNKAENFLAVVCDGVGSVKGSEHASRIVAKTFVDNFTITKKIDSPTIWFKESLKDALIALVKYGKEHRCPNIATTLAVLIVIDDKFYTYNIGDTRIYAIKKHKLTHEIKKYSYDHNYKNYLIAHEASEEVLEANRSKWHALTNLVDASNPKIAKFDSNSGKFDQATYFLICTDGLYGYVRDNDKYEIINRIMLPLSTRLALLNKKAIQNGSDDNISGILVSAR